MPDNIKSPIADINALNTVYQETKDQISKRVSKTSYDLDETLGSSELPYKNTYVEKIIGRKGGDSLRSIEIDSRNIDSSGKVSSNFDDVKTIDSSDVIISNLGVSTGIRTPHDITNISSSKFFEVFDTEENTGKGMKYNETTGGIDFIC